MKKIILTAVFAVGALLSTNAQKIEYGAKAGLNIANLIGDGADGSDSRTSFHIGGMLNYEVSDKFSIQPEIFYSAQGANFEGHEDFGGDFEIRLDYINIPILADYTFAEGFSVQFGPQFGININSEIEFDGASADFDEANTLDLGVVAGVQYTLEQGIFFQARYALGLNEIAEDSDSQNGVIALSVGYKFN